MSRTKERKRIAKDPFHQQILDALGRHLDPQVFEACMADLLRDVFPGLVPVPGGNDAGMDGAIADGKGEPFPLVCTTGEDVAGNLRDSLDAFQVRGLSSRKVALATSRTLTPPEARELFRLAEEKGFKLLQALERSALANLLYHKTVWCKRLLGLSGAPSALSVVPLSRRPQVDIELRGRDEDARWLQDTSGDRVVLGYPGSGKTYLFSSLIRSGWPALFLVSDDDTAIANAVRDQNPGIVIVDDAHVALKRLDRLRRLRDEIQGEFEIVASSWPGAGTDVVEAMGGIPESRIHNLGPLTRAEILEIFQDLDVRPRDEILYDLVSQAGNKPGLAVTIALLWRQGEWQKILDGSVLRRTLLSLFRDLLGQEVAEVLASFSLGGDQGVAPAAVGKFLQLPPGAVDRIVAGLSAGGVLSEVSRSSLAVKPEVLRSALLREVFFSGKPTAFNYRQLLCSATNVPSAIRAIMAARLYKAEVDDLELRRLIKKTSSADAWGLFAQTSKDAAEWALENYPGNIVEIATSVLINSPESAILRLLEQAADSKNHLTESMQIVVSWVRETQISSAKSLGRRQIVANVGKMYLEGGGLCRIAVQAFCIALVPTVGGIRPLPFVESGFTISRGRLHLAELNAMVSVWDQAKGSIGTIDSEIWDLLWSVLVEWAALLLSARSSELAGEERAAIRNFSSRLMSDLVPLVQESPGLTSALVELAQRIDLNLPLHLDPAFEALMSPWNPQALESGEKERWAGVADDWSGLPPTEVAKKVIFYDGEAKKIGRGGQQKTADVCYLIAQSVNDMYPWIDAFLKSGSSVSRHLRPFIERAVVTKQLGWEATLEQFLGDEEYSSIAVELILKLVEPPDNLLERTLGEIARFTYLAETLCLRGEVPVETLRRLFQHSDEKVALVAAIGEWAAHPRGEVRNEVAKDWKEAILRAMTLDLEAEQSWSYQLGEILAGLPSLAESGGKGSGLLGGTPSKK